LLIKIWICRKRFLLNDVPAQANQVKQLFIKAKSKNIEIITPQIVIFEIEFGLEKYYRFSKAEIVDKLSVILTTPYLKIQDAPIFQDALQLFSAHNLDFVDCFILCQAKSTKATLITFDKALQKLTN